MINILEIILLNSDIIQAAAQKFIPNKKENSLKYILFHLPLITSIYLKLHFNSVPLSKKSFLPEKRKSILTKSSITK